ncbi:TetR/AcrR family transcriptional regulator [Saccharothrix deserti]|uniref:TetR/AcrR family transcriptional regulator n=1 Tax=Saccharothrix deserti TaxID=2593674 RepID=UPI00131EA0CD|nr:TetR/AcrR family transcriptional regulator [Saccharothrix deserti]
MTTETERHLRADAARNAERILRAAREVYADVGPEAPLDEIARRAGVGTRTLYRRFPNKEELVRAVLEQSFAEDLTPAIERALNDDDPRNGLVTLLEAMLSMVDRDRNTLAAANNSGALTTEISAPLLDSLTLLTRRGQQAGLIRADLVPEDTHRILGMLVSVLWSTAPRADGWRRYVALVLDALSPEGATPLPPLTPFVRGDNCLM